MSIAEGPDMTTEGADLKRPHVPVRNLDVSSSIREALT